MPYDSIQAYELKLLGMNGRSDETVFSIAKSKTRFGLMW